MSVEPAWLTTLDSGLRVATHRIPGAPKVEIAIGIEAGSRDEVAGNNPRGTGHYLEHKLADGSKKHPRRVRPMIEGRSEDGTFGLTTFLDYIRVAAEVPRARMERALDVLGAMTVQPNITQRHVDQERREIDAERIDGNFEFSSLEDLRAPHVAHGMNPLLFPVIGSKEGIQATTAETLKNFHAETFRAGRVVVAVTGDFDRDRVARFIEKSFPLPQGERTPTERPEYTGGDMRYPPGEGDGVRVAVSFRTPVATEFREAAIYNVAYKLLLERKGPHSIYKALRPQSGGVIYKIRTGCIQSRDSGLLSIAYNTAPENVATSLRIINRVFTGMAAQIDEKAFELVKGREQAEFDRIMNLQSIGAKALMEDVFAHGLNKPPTYAANLRLNVTREEVQEAAKAMLANPTFLAKGETESLPRPGEAAAIISGQARQRRLLYFPENRMAG